MLKRLIASLCCLLLLACDKQADTVQWHMVNVNNTNLQGDAHVLIADDEVFMIDSGYTAPAVEKLIPYLQSLGIKKISKAFVSHAHQDHYEGFSAMIGSGFVIEDIYFNTPSAEIKDCCYNAADFNNHVQYWKKNGVTVHTAATGDSFELGHTTLKVIHAQNDNLPDQQIDVNDLSVIMQWQVGSYTTLFTGDLNKTMGQWLVDNKSNQLKADMLKVPHHGARGIAPVTFFEQVNPSYMMVPGPKWLWCGERGALARTFSEKNAIPALVNGIHGSVITIFTDESATISSDEHEILDCNEKSVPTIAIKMLKPPIN